MNHQKIATIIQKLLTYQYKVITIESASCGALANLFGQFSGISQIYIGGFITYWTEAKHWLLDIDSHTLNTYGAVSEQTAKAMCLNARQKIPAADISISITGNCGPNPMEDKPVGMFYVGISFLEQHEIFQIQIPDAGRLINQQHIAEWAILLLDKFLK